MISGVALAASGQISTTSSNVREPEITASKSREIDTRRSLSKREAIPSSSFASIKAAYLRNNTSDAGKSLLHR